MVALQLARTDAPRIGITLLGVPFDFSSDGRAVASLSGQTAYDGPYVAISDQPPAEPATPRRATHPRKGSVNRRGAQGN
eukprot:15465535-Alexandrium_andersonii.AAC.1